MMIRFFRRAFQTDDFSMTCDDVHQCRTIPTIIYSCASTIFLCTWVAFHPNVPRNPDDKAIKMLLQRIGNMMVALVAPEYMLLSAFDDWTSSCDNLKRLIEKCRDCGWTETHAQFAWMGGFRLIHEDGTRQNMRKENMFDELMAGTVEFPTITVDEIEDRSKGDNVAKAIALTQTLWFAAQMIARVNQGLIVTELELTTLGHVVINVFISFCWWHKPLGIRFPVGVRRIRSEKDEEVPKSFLTGQQPPPLAWRVILGAYINNAWTDPRSLRRVFISMWIIGGLFGAVHCLAWESTFQTSVESILWKVSAMTISLAPGIIYTVYMFLSILQRDGSKRMTSPMILVPVLIYVVARVCLLVLALIALRALSYRAYRMPLWTLYIPHVG